VATSNPYGSPQVSLTWIDTDGEHVLVNTTNISLKVRNIKHDPRISIAVVDNSNPYSMMRLQGKVVEQIAGNLAEEHIDKLAKRYTGADRYAFRQPSVHRVILKVKPVKVTPPRW
jgi:PPOX class probable F420-dependent enzyme